MSFLRSIFGKKEPSEGGEVRKRFPTKVVGVTRKNNDGTSRQKIIKQLRTGQELELVPEPDNPFDSDAIKVCTKRGEQVGYLEARLAGEVARRMRRGIKHTAKVLSIVGGFEGGKTLGCVLELTIYHS